MAPDGFLQPLSDELQVSCVWIYFEAFRKEEILKACFQEIEVNLELEATTLTVGPKKLVKDEQDMKVTLSENFWVGVPTHLIKHSRVLLLYKVAALERLLLHYKSLNVPLPLKFNKSTIKSLDATYDTIDGHVTTTLKELRTDIDKIHETTDTTIMQILTYVIGAFTLLNSITLLGILLYLTRKLPRQQQLNIRSSYIQGYSAQFMQIYS